MIQVSNTGGWFVCIAGGDARMIDRGWALGSVCGWVHSYTTQSPDALARAIADGMQLGSQWSDLGGMIGRGSNEAETKDGARESTI